MSCIPLGEPALTKDDLDRWTTDVTILLDSPRARKKFNDFLLVRKLRDAEQTLQFWEKCNAVLLEITSRHDQLRHDQIAQSRFFTDAEHLLEFAEEYINFDISQLQTFRQVVERRRIPQILQEITKVQNLATLLLRDEYNLFRTNILKDVAPSK